MDRDKVLTLKDLTKEYDSFKAVDRVSFFIAPGEIVGLLGPNGAGKTTTINMILGIVKPTSGTIEILGRNTKDCYPEINSMINFAAVYAHMPANLTVRQNLYVFSLLYGIKKAKRRVEELLFDFELEKFADRKTGLLSSGEQSRLQLAKALINQPELLLLDEPTASLDPAVSRLIRRKIVSYAKEHNIGILWTSHNMQEIEAVCHKVLFLSHGRILLEGNPRTMPGEYKKKDLEELFIAIAREPLIFGDQ
jgi:ABC-2 type transport system ATP-binding protein